jgi:tyrosine-specific transport protein
MSEDRRRFMFATAQLIGTTIGVGVFGVPYALSKIGLFWGALYFVVLGGIQLLQHLFYAEAAIACPDKLRLPGLVERYLGKRAKHVAGVSMTFGYWASILAYLIVGGTFLHVLLSPLLGGEVFTYQIIWLCVVALVVRGGLNLVSKIGFATTSGVIIAMVTIIALGLPHMRSAAFLPPAVPDFILPYGVILFSLGALPAILEMEDVLKGKHGYYRTAIITGTLTAAALTAAFGFVIWGVTGPSTTPDGVAGLRLALGNGVTTLTAVFGLLATMTACFSVSINLQNTIRYDYKVRKTVAWLMTFGVPFGIFLWGAKNFVAVISFSGAVFGGITAVLVALLYVAVTKRGLVKDRPLGIPPAFAYLSVSLLVFGAAYQVVSTAMKVLK